MQDIFCELLGVLQDSPASCRNFFQLDFLKLTEIKTSEMMNVFHDMVN